MKKACYGLGILVIFAGVVSSIPLCIKLGVNSFTRERDWGLTIGIFIGILFSAIVLGVIMLAISEVLERSERQSEILEKILPALESMSDEAKEEEILNDGGWKCPMCGKANRFYTVYCSCGQKKE